MSFLPLLSRRHATWEKPFQALAEECQLNLSIGEAFTVLQNFYEMLG